MCMLAGYIGKQAAAPILLDMIRRQEAINGGYYTGIATVDNKLLYAEKVVGSADVWANDKDARGLPGSTGIAHSRTNDGGGYVRAQPYVCQRSLASVGNGEYGVFEAEVRQRLHELGNELQRDGVNFSSTTTTATPNDVVLSDGSLVHGGEVATAAVFARINEGHSFFEAVRQAGIRWQAIQVFVDLESPGTIRIANQTMSLVIARHGEDVYIATSRLGLPIEPEWCLEVPGNSLIEVSAARTAIEPLWSSDFQLSEANIKEACGAFVRFVLENPGASWPAACAGLVSLFDDGRIPCVSRAGHRVLEALLSCGDIRYELAGVTGADGQLNVPQMQLFAN